MRLPHRAEMQLSALRPSPALPLRPRSSRVVKTPLALAAPRSSARPAEALAAAPLRAPLAHPARGTARRGAPPAALGFGALTAASGTAASGLGALWGKLFGSGTAAAAAGVGGGASAAAAGLGWWPWWALLAVLVGGMFLGLAVAKASAKMLNREYDPNQTSLENRELRSKIEELQQLVMNIEPLAQRSMKLRFTKGINKAVILGLVDQMLSNRDVNIWWLPDALERLIYFNTITLMLQVLDEVVEGMSINLAGHNVRLQLSFLDLDRGEDASIMNAKKQALVSSALSPVKAYGQQQQRAAAA